MQDLTDGANLPATLPTPRAARDVQRKLLRAFNGAALGAVIGGALGYGLGAASAVGVDLIAAMFYGSTPVWLPQWGLCAAMGLIPAVPAGLLLGTFIILRSDRQRLESGAVLGLLVGIAYERLWMRSSTEPNLVSCAVVGSGLVGGLGLALILTAIRRHWKWWTRWETPALGTDS